MQFMVPRFEEAFFELPTTNQFLDDREALAHERARGENGTSIPPFHTRTHTHTHASHHIVQLPLFLTGFPHLFDDPSPRHRLAATKRNKNNKK